MTGLSTLGEDENGDTIFDYSMGDGKPHLVLSYINGPAWSYHHGNSSTPTGEMPRRDLTQDHKEGLIGKGTPFGV